MNFSIKTLNHQRTCIYFNFLFPPEFFFREGSSLCMRQFMIVIAANYHHVSRIHIFCYGQRASWLAAPQSNGNKSADSALESCHVQFRLYSVLGQALTWNYLQIKGWTAQMRLFLLYKCPSKIMFIWTVCIATEVIFNKACYVDEIIDSRFKKISIWYTFFYCAKASGLVFDSY